MKTPRCFGHCIPQPIFRRSVLHHRSGKRIYPVKASVLRFYACAVCGAPMHPNGTDNL